MDPLAEFLLNAPSGIVQPLLELLPPESLHSLMVSNNRRLHHLASQLLWRDRVLHGLEDFEAFAATLCSPSTTLSYGSLIDSLTINMFPDRDEEEDEPSLWASYFLSAAPKLSSLRR